MRAAKNVSITLPPGLLKQAQQVARREGRTRSELFREALRRYVMMSQFRALQQYGIQQSSALGLQPNDVNRLIREVRQEEKRRRRPAVSKG